MGECRCFEGSGKTMPYHFLKWKEMEVDEHLGPTFRGSPTSSEPLMKSIPTKSIDNEGQPILSNYAYRHAL